MSDRVFNFSAGPGVLPEEVLKLVQRDVWNIAGSGIGILEHSHRGKVVDKVFEECEADCRKLGNVPPNYRIIFLTGGASAQNHMIPMNLLPQGRTADYIVTGFWGQKSYEQAAKMGPAFGKANLAFTGKPDNYSTVPTREQLKYSDTPAYLHYVSNETISGVQFRADPWLPPGVPVIVDASSEIFSQPIDISKYAMVYAGAQKNVGAAGATLAIIRDDMIERGNKDIADLLQYRAYPPELSRPNTPPVFAVYIMGQVFKWLLRNGGLATMKKQNDAKAKLIYDAMDSTPFYRPHARKDCRSLMNIVFRTPSEALDEAFVKEAAAQGMDGLKGHRSTGGIRASVYNAFPVAGCERLAAFMREFARKNLPAGQKDARELAEKAG